jgi:cytochrome c556
MRIGPFSTFVLVALVAVSSCAAGQKPSTTVSSLPLLPDDSNVVHAVQSAKLREAMRGLEEIATQRLPDRIDEKGHRQSELREVARLADELARGAAEIPDSLAANPLPADDERRFRELAEQLVRDSFALRDRAILGEVGSVRDETEQLLATCNACHAMARVTPTAHAEAAPRKR